VNIIAELSKKFQSSVAALTLNISSEPISTGSNRPSQVDNQASPTEKSMLNAVESFVKVLHFCAAVVATASSNSDPSASSIRPVMLKLFVDVFLQAVKSCLLENGEEQVLAAQSILRRMLLETFEAPGKKDNSVTNLDDNCASERLIAGFSRNVNPLCTTITTYVCDDEEILQVLVRRVGSVSRSVSVSTIQLLSSLLSISSLSGACKLVIGGSREACLQTNETIKSSASTDASSDTKIASSLESFLLQYMSSCKDSALDIYMKASINHILGKLASSIEPMPFKFCPENMDDEFGPLFLVSFQKLQSFLSLKYDEQLAVTGLVNKCILVLMASLLNFPSPALISRVFCMLSKFFDFVHNLEAELHCHKTNIPEVDVKFKMIREVLAAPTTCDPQTRKIIDKENQQVVRILESCIIIEELIHEMEGSILALQQLQYLFIRTTPLEYSPSDIQRALVSPPSPWNEDSWSTDDEHDDEHDDEQRHEDDHRQAEGGESTFMMAQNLTMDNFLFECESMEDQLEEVLSSLSSASSNIAE
jgi:hypothetical protein